MLFALPLLLRPRCEKRLPLTSPHLTLSYVALDHIIQQLQEVAGAEFDLWTIAQHQPHFFAKGGDYYKQVVRAYGGNVADNTHFQFREFPGKTFAFNKKEERLEVCLTHCIVFSLLIVNL